MTRRIRDVLLSRSQSQIDDRDAALATLITCLQDEGPIVAWLYGPIGAGKSDLLLTFASNVEAGGATVHTMDCRTVEPTVSGLINAFGELTGTSPKDLEHAASVLSRSSERVVIALDNYEVFRLMDTWLRREFIPALAETVRVVLVSRDPPSSGWITAAEWRDCFLAVSLDGPAEPDPEELTRRYLQEVPQLDIRRTLEAVSVVRRITRPILAALCPGVSADDMYDSLSNLPFLEKRRDGLAIQDVVRKVIGHRLQASDPERYRHYQRESWRLLRQQLRDSTRSDLWRCTADIIYLIENPVIREAFFPSESSRLSVEPAMPDDKQDVMDIAARHELAAAFEALNLWWNHLPHAFHIVKDASGSTVGFYCIAKPSELDSNWMQLDPIARKWQFHLRRDSLSNQVAGLFLRRWLSRDHGEAPCPVQAAVWIDIKRLYLELRPELRRVYLTLQDIGPYGPVATELGFAVLEDLTASLSGTPYHTAMLDFGPGSVDGWICNLLAAELGSTEDQLFDAAARELVLNGARTPLTPLECGVMTMLASRSGEAVSRSDLLTQVWGHRYEGGSNVVDAVIRGIRKKCGKNADFLETVRGVGYRLRA